MYWFSLVLLTVTTAETAVLQLYEGDSCTCNNGIKGVCKLLIDCETVYREFQAGQYPESNCGYNYHESIICCPLTSNPFPISSKNTSSPLLVASLTATESPISTTTHYLPFRPSYKKIPFIDPNQYGAVSMRRCYEFGQRICPKHTDAVLGGYKVRLGQFPFMAAVGYKTKNTTRWLCGGSIVGEKFILSAAHCQFSLEFGRPKVVRVGNLKLESSYADDFATPQLRNIIQIIAHPQYKYPSEYHDIAVFKLDQPITFGYYTRQACLSPYPTNDGVVNNTVFAAGWGVTDWGDDVGSNDLMAVQLNLVDHQTCNKSYDTGAPDPKIEFGIVDKWQMCAGGKGKDTCQGDSGGPIMRWNKVYDCVFDIIGITSIGRLCGSDLPGVYTRVYNYLPWLEQVIWGHEKTNFTITPDNQYD